MSAYIIPSSCGLDASRKLISLQYKWCGLPAPLLCRQRRFGHPSTIPLATTSYAFQTASIFQVSTPIPCLPHFSIEWCELCARDSDQAQGFIDIHTYHTYIYIHIIYSCTIIMLWLLLLFHKPSMMDGFPRAGHAIPELWHILLVPLATLINKWSDSIGLLLWILLSKYQVSSGCCKGLVLARYLPPGYVGTSCQVPDARYQAKFKGCRLCRRASKKEHQNIDFYVFSRILVISCLKSWFWNSFRRFRYNLLILWDEHGSRQTCASRQAWWCSPEAEIS